MPDNDLRYKAEIRVVFQDAEGEVHRGAWFTTQEPNPSAYRAQFEASSLAHGNTILSLELVSEQHTIIDEAPPVRVRPKLQLVRGWVVVCSAWLLDRASALHLDVLGSIA